MYDEKKIVLAPSRPKGSSKNHNKGLTAPEASKKSLHLLNKNQILRESKGRYSVHDSVRSIRAHQYVINEINIQFGCANPGSQNS